MSEQLSINNPLPNIPSANLQEQLPHSLFWSWNVGYSPSVANTRETIHRNLSKVYLRPSESPRSVICEINCSCIVLTDWHRAWAAFRWSCQTITHFHSLSDLLQGPGIFSWNIWAFLEVLFNCYGYVCRKGGLTLAFWIMASIALHISSSKDMDNIVLNHVLNDCPTKISRTSKP